MSFADRDKSNMSRNKSEVDGFTIFCDSRLPWIHKLTVTDCDSIHLFLGAQKRPDSQFHFCGEIQINLIQIRESNLNRFVQV